MGDFPGVRMLVEDYKNVAQGRSLQYLEQLYILNAVVTQIYTYK